MNSLRTIQGLNAKAELKAARSKNADNPHASMIGDAADGIAVCGPYGRQATFISAGPRAANFLARWIGTNSPSERDAVAKEYLG